MNIKLSDEYCISEICKMMGSETLQAAHVGIKATENILRQAQEDMCEYHKVLGKIRDLFFPNSSIAAMVKRINAYDKQ